MKKIRNLLIIMSGILTVFYIINHNGNLTLSKYLVIISLYPVYFVPSILKILFKFDLDENIEFSYVLFIFVAQFLGSVIGFYGKFYYYDKITHFISGILTSFIALDLLDKYKIKNKKFTFLFMIIFSVFVAAFWEFFEYTSDLLLHGDVQKVLKTGVSDTMQDMLCAFFSSTICSILYYFSRKNVKNN